MALIQCPECNKSISDTAEKCPHCGYSLAERKEFVKVVKPLSNKQKTGYGKASVGMICGIAMIAIGIPLCAIGVGVILIILGIVCFFSSGMEAKKYQYGECPYCGTELRVEVGNTSFKCPVCNNVGTQTENTLESTH